MGAVIPRIQRGQDTELLPTYSTATLQRVCSFFPSESQVRRKTQLIKAKFHEEVYGCFSTELKILKLKFFVESADFLLSMLNNQITSRSCLKGWILFPDSSNNLF
jgi:hypothetical protein